MNKLLTMISQFCKKLFIDCYPIMSHPLFGIVISAILFTIAHEIITNFIFGGPIGYGESTPSVPTEPLPSKPNEPLPSAPNQSEPSIPNQLKLDAPNKHEPFADKESTSYGLEKPRVMTQAEIVAQYGNKKTIRDFYHETNYSLDLAEKEVTKPLKDNPEQLRNESSHDYPDQ